MKIGASMAFGVSTESLYMCVMSEVLVPCLLHELLEIYECFNLVLAGTRVKSSFRHGTHHYSYGTVPELKQHLLCLTASVRMRNSQSCGRVLSCGSSLPTRRAIKHHSHPRHVIKQCVFMSNGSRLRKTIEKAPAND